MPCPASVAPSTCPNPAALQQPRQRRRCCRTTYPSRSPGHRLQGQGQAMQAPLPTPTRAPTVGRRSLAQTSAPRLWRWLHQLRRVALRAGPKAGRSGRAPAAARLTHFWTRSRSRCSFSSRRRRRSSNTEHCPVWRKPFQSKSKRSTACKDPVLNQAAPRVRQPAPVPAAPATGGCLRVLVMRTRTLATGAVTEASQNGCGRCSRMAVAMSSRLWCQPTNRGRHWNDVDTVRIVISVVWLIIIWAVEQ